MTEELLDYALPREGEIFDGQYVIGRVLGIGGMAAVLAAKHLGLDEMVALKILLPECCDDPAVVERFAQEGRTAVKIRSEHVVRMRDVGVVDGRSYLVMEHLDGLDLDLHLRKVGPLAVAEAVDFLLQACEAIGEAHVLGIIHRDLKPANLFLTHRADGSPCVKVLDFGISRIPRGITTRSTGPQATLPSLVMGSPQYMSPEQMVSAAKADQRSDIWSLGTVLYELLTGRIAFEGSSTTAICARVLQGDPEPLAVLRPELPQDLAAVLARCFEKVPSARYATVAELARALAPFGTTRARASAESITRVMEGVASATTSSEGRVPSSASLNTMKPTAAEILATVPTRERRVSGYLVGTLVAAVSLCALLGYAARTGRFASPLTTEISAAQGGTALAVAPVAAAVAPPSVAAPLPAAEPIPVMGPRVTAPARRARRAVAKAIAVDAVRATDAGIEEEVGPYDTPAGSDGTVR